MNGARSIFMRKGYWLTALAAIVLLAASPGTASAQITAKVDKEVAEGDTVRITFTAKAIIEISDSAGSITVTVDHSGDNTGATNEDADVVGNPSTAELRFPAGETGADAENIMVTVTGVAVLQTTQDPDAEDEVVTPTYTLEAGAFSIPTGQEEDNPQTLTAPADGSFTIKDDETQTYVLALSPSSQKPKEGDMVTVSLKADPVHEDGAASMVLNLDTTDPDYSVSPDAAMLNLGNGSEMTLTVTTKASDGNRVSDTLTLTAYSGRAGASKLEDSLAIKLADNHELPAVTMLVVDEDGDKVDPQPTSVPEGKSVMVVVMSVDKDGDADDAEEELTVALTPTGTADSADYTLVGTFTIDDGDDTSNAVEIEVRSDEDVGMESLMFDAVVSGESANGPGTLTSAAVLSLNIEDATAKKITPKASDADYDALKAVIAAAGGDDGVNPGDTVTIMTSDLFDLMDGYTASYGVSVEGDSASASASGEAVTIKALMAGEAKITVTGTARMASSSLMPTQTVSNVAELTFPVMVVDTTLVVTLSADPIEVEAGGTTMITATANRYVTAGDGDVEIALAVVGDGMLDAESIMIAMGEMSGSAMLTANESLTVVATGSGISGLMQVKVTVTDPDAPDPDAPDPDAPDPDAPDPDAPDPDAPDPDAPDPDAPDPDAPDPDAPEPVPTPALPLIAQWLLGLGLMGGGARQLFRRRRQG